jgi:hypothetical protein
MQEVVARNRSAAYLVLGIALCAAMLPLSTLTAMVLIIVGVAPGFQSQHEFGTGDVPTLITFLLIAVFIALIRALVRAPREPVTAARLRVQGFLLVAECLGGGLLAATTGADAVSAGLAGAGLSVGVTGFLIAGWLQTLPKPQRAPEEPHARPAPRGTQRPPGTQSTRTRPPRRSPSRPSAPRSRPARRPESVPPAPHFFPGTTAPAPRQIWFADVPFDDDTGSKVRPCLVMRTSTHHAEVLKITSVNKSHRDEYVRLPVASWDPKADHDSWLELSPLREVPYYDFRRYAGWCDSQAWKPAAEANGIR